MTIPDAMGTGRKLDLDRRLDAWFATLHSSPLKNALKRSVANWELYAAVSGSAMAMATGASAALIGTAARIPPEPTASVRTTRRNVGSSNPPPFLKNVRLAMAAQGAGQRFMSGARIGISAASQTQAPSIKSGGVTPIYGRDTTIQPGEWVSIYGQNLAAKAASWNGDFPTSLGGTSVTIDGRPAYLSYVSPDQINLQAPDDAARGKVTVVVTTAAGTATATVTLSDFAPSFSLFDVNNVQYVAGIILRSDHSGAYGGGTYDILGPTGKSLGFMTVAAQAGDVVELFGVGFGPTTPAVRAGKPFSGAAAVNNPVSLYINHILIQPTFVGLSSAGLYQINFLVPAGLGEGEVAMHLSVGGMRTQKGVLFSLRGNSGGTGAGGSVGSYVPGIGGGFVGTSAGTMPGSMGGTGGGTAGGTGAGGGGGATGGGTGGGGGGGTGGGGGGGTGGGDGGGGSGGGTGGGGGSGGGSAAIRSKPWQPRMQFTPDDSVRES